MLKRLAATAAIAIPLLGTTAAVAVAPMHYHGSPSGHVRLAGDGMHYHGNPLADGPASDMHYHG